MPRTTSISHSSIKASTTEVSPTFFAKAAVKFKAEKQAKKIIASLDEVKRVQQGKKTPKSFDEFLNEL
jgi:hypothetical protein